MASFPWLTVTAAIPLAGALIVALVPGEGPAASGIAAAPGSPGEAAGPVAGNGRNQLVKLIALAATVAALGVSAAMAAEFAPGGPRFQFTQTYAWIPQFGVHYAVGVDGIALVLILMTTVLAPMVVLGSWHAAETGRRRAGGAPVRYGVKTYYALLLSLETMMIMAFAATDVFLFYVFFEAMLVPMYFMIGSYGVGQRQYAAVKFLLYSLAGGLLMLVALIALYVYSARGGHGGTFLFVPLTHLRLSGLAGKWLFLGFFIAFAIKAPLWPFHTWLPDAAASAQPGDAVLMIGVMDKVGTFGMIRYCLQLFPNASHFFAPLILVLSVIGVLYAAIVAIGQADMKRLIGYLSISGMGLITLGIFAMTSQGQSGATLQMVNHGFLVGALFLLAGFLISRRRSPLIDDYGGVQKVAPVLAGLFLISGLAGLALPGLNTFVSEFLILLGTFTKYKVAASFATAGIILSAIYLLWMYQRMMTGPVRPDVENLPDLAPRELWAVAPLIALIIALGVYPKPAFSIINPAVRQTLVQLHSTDPVPPHPPRAGLAAVRGGR
jgi:NADH-quinone oxidoreductase subunit M